jgi:RHS repeat-associated protein
MRGVLTVMMVLGLVGTATAQSAEVVEYYHLDALGSVRAVTNQSGAVVRTHDYRPFGEGENPAAGSEPTRFTGKERDAESGLDYFGARYYASRAGRFTTVDPKMNTSAALADPQRWNRYAYALNNPLRNIDPDGRDTIDLAIGFGQGIWNTAKGIVALPYALVTDPGSVASGIAQDIRLLGHGVRNPGEVLDAYVSLATSANDAWSGNRSRHRGGRGGARPDSKRFGQRCSLYRRFWCIGDSEWRAASRRHICDQGW